MHNFSGKLNSKGSVKIPYSIDTKKVFFIQSFLFYLKNWRPVNAFFNDKHLWLDLGPEYKELPYRMHLLISKKSYISKNKKDPKKENFIDALDLNISKNTSQNTSQKIQKK